MSRLCSGSLLLSWQADDPGHLVEVKALASLDYSLVVVVLPWGKHEQAPLGTGIKTAASWLGKGCKAVFLKHDDGKTSLKCRLHHGLLPGADAR